MLIWSGPKSCGGGTDKSGGRWIRWCERLGGRDGGWTGDGGRRRSTVCFSVLISWRNSVSFLRKTEISSLNSFRIEEMISIVDGRSLKFVAMVEDDNELSSRMAISVTGGVGSVG